MLDHVIPDVARFGMQCYWSHGCALWRTGATAGAAVAWTGGLAAAPFGGAANMTEIMDARRTDIPPAYGNSRRPWPVHRRDSPKMCSGSQRRSNPAKHVDGVRGPTGDIRSAFTKQDPELIAADDARDHPDQHLRRPGQRC